MFAFSPPVSEPSSDRYLAVLAEHACGTLSADAALVVDAHLALRPEARATLDVLESAGGVLLESLPPVEIAAPDWLRRAHADMPAPSATSVGTAQGDPVATLLGSLDQGHWRRGLSGLLTKPVPGSGARLLKLEAGRKAPRHGHRGLELTLVLHGTFADDDGLHGRGALLVHDEDTEHAPGAPAGGDCICLVAEPGPVRLKGPLGWVLDRMASG